MTPAFRRERLKLTRQAMSCFASIIWRLWIRRIVFFCGLFMLPGCAIWEGLKEANNASGLGGRKPTCAEVASYRKQHRRDYPTSDRERWQFMYEHGQLTLPEYQKLIGAKAE